MELEWRNRALRDEYVSSRRCRESSALGDEVLR